MKKPQLIILDYNLPGTSGELLLRELKYRLPTTKYIVYTFSQATETVRKMLNEGVDGYVLKSEDDDEIVKAIDCVLSGKNYYCKEVRNQIVNQLNEQENQRKQIIGGFEFSAKEIEIIELICKQKTAKEMSKYVFLSERTVEQYRSNISKRIGAQNIGCLHRILH